MCGSVVRTAASSMRHGNVRFHYISNGREPTHCATPHSCHKGSLHDWHLRLPPPVMAAPGTMRHAIIPSNGCTVPVTKHWLAPSLRQVLPTPLLVHSVSTPTSPVARTISPCYITLNSLHKSSPSCPPPVGKNGQRRSTIHPASSPRSIATATTSVDPSVSVSYPINSV
eukprot:COSAG01_NODE_68_length_28978_cov_182.027777_28_plen_169_part_00